MDELHIWLPGANKYFHCHTGELQWTPVMAICSAGSHTESQFHATKCTDYSIGHVCGGISHVCCGIHDWIIGLYLLQEAMPMLYVHIHTHQRQI